MVAAFLVAGLSAFAPCDGKIVSAITIVVYDPSFLRVPPPLRTFARVVGLHHTTTQPEVIERFLLLDVGQQCTERRRAESERILRYQPFLAEATVRTVPDEAGGVRIEVVTVDEIPTVFNLRFRDGRPSALRLGNSNVAGRGIYLAVRGERGYAYRAGIGVELAAHQTLGRPYPLTLVADRTPLGSTVSGSFGHPFITDLQQTAWHVGFRDVRNYTFFLSPKGEGVALSARRRFADVGGVLRVGLRGRSAFVGGVITAEQVVPAGGPVFVTDSGFVADTSSQLGGPFAQVNNTRLNAVLGLRSVAFLTVRGFDALVGTQDVAKGFQFGALVGRGVSTGDDDLFLAADLYGGLGSATSFLGLRVNGEGLQEKSSGRWSAMAGSGRLAWYAKPTVAVVLIGSAELSGGWRWRDRFPFQLRLGDREGGVRGYNRSRIAGAVRSVARLEARRVMGQVKRHVAVGLAAFTDLGRVWAGDAPFGVDSRTMVGVGVGLLAALPAQSRQLWRLDIAVPVSADAHARWEMRLTATRIRDFWREPSVVTRARVGAAPSTIFTWP